MIKGTRALWLEDFDVLFFHFTLIRLVICGWKCCRQRLFKSGEGAARKCFSENMKNRRDLGEITISLRRAFNVFRMTPSVFLSSLAAASGRSKDPS